MKNYLVLVGHKGYVGSEVLRELQEDNFNVITLERGQTIKPYISDLYGVVNCAGWGGNTCIDEVVDDVRKCEMDNFELVAELNSSLQYAKSDVPFITMSTGCMFSDLYGASINTEPNNFNPYTLLKLKAEKEISHENTLILRPRLIFSDKVSSRNPLYKIVNYDQVFDSQESATPLVALTRYIKEALVIMKKNPLPKKFISHCVSRKHINWAEVAEVMKQKGMRGDFEKISPRAFNGFSKVQRSSTLLIDNLLDGTSRFPRDAQHVAINMLDSLKANMSIQ